MVKSGRLSDRDVRTVMAEVLSGKDVDDALDRGEQTGDDELEEKIASLIKQKPGMRPNAYMGLVMKEFGGKVDSKRAMEIIQRITDENGS